MFPTTVRQRLWFLAYLYSSLPVLWCCHGRPVAPEAEGPKKTGENNSRHETEYVVITSVITVMTCGGGAQHFADCNREIRELNPNIRIETLVSRLPRSYGRCTWATERQSTRCFLCGNGCLPRLCRKARQVRATNGLLIYWSLKSSTQTSQQKSGVMMGLGETKEEIIQVLKDLREHGVTMLTLGQYLAPSRHHLPVERYVPPSEFDELKVALELGFTHAACGPFVRSSYPCRLASTRYGNQVTLIA